MLVFLAALGFLTTIVLAPPVYAAVDCNLNPSDPSCPARVNDLVPILERIISILAPAAAIAFLVMFLVGGFQFVTSGGDPKAVAQARSTLTVAVIGIILVVGAWLILTLIQAITGVPVTIVNLPI